MNRAKSAVSLPWERNLLGFSFKPKEAKLRIAPKALANMMDRISGLKR